MSIEYLASKVTEYTMRGGKTPKKPMGWHSVFAFVGAILLIIGAGLLVAPRAVQGDIKPFFENGVSAVAIISDLEIRQASLGYRGINKTEEYWVHVVFMGGTSVATQTDLVRKETFDALKEGGSIHIIYLPNDPKRVMLASELAFYRERGQSAVKGMVFFAGGMTSIAAYVIWDRRKKKYD